MQASSINGDIAVREEEFGFDLNFAEMLFTDFGGNVGPIKTVASFDRKGSFKSHADRGLEWCI